MEKKTDAHVFKGMRKDIDPHKQDSSYYIDALNIRLITRGENEDLMIMTEKCAAPISLTYEDSNDDLSSISIIGSYVGHQVIGNYVVLFTTLMIDTVNHYDRIYRLFLDSENEVYTYVMLYGGDLGFNTTTRLETLGSYESELVRKVYFTDGVSQPKVINIMKAELMGVSAQTMRENYYNDDSFNFVRTQALAEEITIEKTQSSSGSFPAGVLQYAITYYDKYGQETNIAWTSPLIYTSIGSRAGSPEETVGNAFKITIGNPSTNFDYLRIYSIMRTSLDSTPTVKRVVDLACRTYQESDSGYSQGEVNAVMAFYSLSVAVGSTGYYRDGNSSAWINLNTLEKVFYSETDLTQGCLCVVFRKGDHPNLLIKLMNYGEYQFYGFSDDATDDNCILVTMSKLVQGGVGASYMIMGFKDDTAKSFAAVVARYETIYNEVVVNGIEFTDTNVSGDEVDPAELMYIGGEEIYCGTMCQKDGTLFLGNVGITRPNIDDDIKTSIRSAASVSCGTRTVYHSDSTTWYPRRDMLNATTTSGGTIYACSLTFKNKETYRLGLQFQYKTGKWSEPLWLCDKQMQASPSATQSYSHLPRFSCSLDLSELSDLGYVKARGVVVFPSLGERQVIAQGLLCPTVYSVSKRENNMPYVQGSWFARPFHKSDYSPNYINYITYNYAQWKHGYSLYSFGSRSSEIQGVPGEFSDADIEALYNSDDVIEQYNKFYYPVLCSASNDFVTPGSSDEDTQYRYVTKDDMDNVFCVDQSYLTFHSPELQWDEDLAALDYTNVKARIVGYSPFGKCYGDVDIETSSPVIGSESTGFKHVTYEGGAQTFASGLFYEDWLVDDNSDLEFEQYDKEDYAVRYMIYPWHRSGSLNNDTVRGADKGTRTAVLSKKVLSNIKISSYTSWLASVIDLGAGYVRYFNSDEVTVEKLGDNTYYGNVNTALAPVIPYGMVFALAYKGDRGPYYGDTHYVNNSYTVKENRSIPDDGTVMATLVNDGMHAIPQANNTINEKRMGINGGDAEHIGDKSASKTLRTTKEFIRMKYKMTPHVILGPVSFTSNDTSYSDLYSYMNSISSTYNNSLMMAELYRENAPTFGGETEDALKNNSWLPAGEAVTISDSTTVYWDYGDTFYQMFDCLRTYPYTTGDENQIVDIISFNVESRINCDGRYDKNRGLVSNLNMSPVNFNLHNAVYNQLDNFFSYRVLDNDYYKINDYPASITWSTEKTAMMDVDPWTSVTMASTLDMDGAMGAVTALRVFNESLYCVQPKQVKRVLFNSRAQIATSDGVPIEISNNYKVDGSVAVTSNVGCGYKDAVCVTSLGMYFIDSQTRDLYVIAGQEGAVNVSVNKGMSSWFKDITGYELWHDGYLNDIYVRTDDLMLCYSERLGEFTSFYDKYSALGRIFSMNDLTLGIGDYTGYNSSGATKLCELNATEMSPTNVEIAIPDSYVEFISNAEPMACKWFTNVNVRGDWYSLGEYEPDFTFNSIRAYDEYQDTGEVELTYERTSTSVNYRNSNARKKFRMWRFNIPRALKDDGTRSRDRISNFWCGIKLSTSNYNRMKIHDLDVEYYVRNDGVGKRR